LKIEIIVLSGNSSVHNKILESEPGIEYIRIVHEWENLAELIMQEKEQDNAV